MLREHSRRVWYDLSLNASKAQSSCCHRCCCHGVHIVWSQRTQLCHRAAVQNAPAFPLRPTREGVSCQSVAGRMLGHSYEQTLNTNTRTLSGTLIYLLWIHTPKVLPSRRHCHSASGCPDLPTMHHWGRTVSCHTARLPDGAFDWGEGQRGQKENPPERRARKGRDHLGKLYYYIFIILYCILYK